MHLSMVAAQIHNGGCIEVKLFNFNMAAISMALPWHDVMCKASQSVCSAH